MQVALESDEELDLPEVNFGYYLVGLLEDIGGVVQNGMGAVPITWTDLKSWADMSGITLTYWELSTLKHMSEAYATELFLATDPKKAPPYKTQEVYRAPDLDNRLKNYFKEVNMSMKLKGK